LRRGDGRQRAVHDLPALRARLRIRVAYGYPSGSHHAPS
jgi:hypothetical protein